MLIVLTGPSCSGKTSLAQAMQRLAGQPLLHWEADRQWPEVPENVDQAFQQQVILGVHESIAALARSGLSIIVDGSLPMEKGLQKRCIDILQASGETRIVGVRCRVDILRHREAARPDRENGWAESQLPTIFANVALDAIVDTAARGPEECAIEPLESLGLR